VLCASVQVKYRVEQRNGKIETFLAPRPHSLPNLDIQHTWFQQDGATSHTARQSMAALKRLFGDRRPDLQTSQSVTTFYGDI
jgi:hypothetical protein